MSVCGGEKDTGVRGANDFGVIGERKERWDKRLGKEEG